MMENKLSNVAGKSVNSLILTSGLTESEVIKPDTILYIFVETSHNIVASVIGKIDDYNDIRSKIIEAYESGLPYMSITVAISDNNGDVVYSNSTFRISDNTFCWCTSSEEVHDRYKMRFGLTDWIEDDDEDDIGGLDV